MDFINYRENGTDVYHDFINIEFALEISIPHEWYFLSLFTKQEIRKNRELASLFVRYVLAYYPNYIWTFFKSEDLVATAVVESELCSYTFLQKYKYGLNVEKENLNKAMKFGDIVTDFLIRFRGYSLIKCSSQNIILTARSDCHKRFEELLSKGYTIERKAKMYYQNGFRSLPILPTRDIAYPFEELIEVKRGHYEKVMQKKY